MRKKDSNIHYDPPIQREVFFDNQEETRAVFGIEDRHLKVVKKAFEVSVVGRHDNVKVKGAPEAVERAERTFLELRRLYAEGVAITPGEVESVAEAIKSEGGATESPEKIEIFAKQVYVRPKTPGQVAYVKAMRRHDIVFSIGVAGTGKTYLAVAMAVSALKKRQVRRLILVRPAVEAGEKLGFLPGDIQAKVNPYLRPLYDALHDMMDYGQLRRYMESDIIEVVPLAYMRGRTLNDSFIILDEAQNCTALQMKMFLTRLGMRSRSIITGDISQVDLPVGERSGLMEAERILKGIEGISFVYLEKRDIVRHALVQSIVEAYDRDDKKNASQARNG
ncbi:MAG: PhoH family protein [Planctomycetes bacterium]|nr:PhoH family protein [Planctomycetota bacterium]